MLLFKKSSLWDEDQFGHIFDLFEEDEEHDVNALECVETGGLDKGEFKKLVMRIAQL